VAKVAEETRTRSDVVLGASPRAALWLARAAQAFALAQGRRYVLPDDVKAVAHHVLDHRLILEPRAKLAGLTARAVVDDVLERVPVPVVPA
jgi:MoxR-like ATPase